MVNMNKLIYSAILLSAAACGQPAETEDPIFDHNLAQSHSELREGTPEAVGFLRLVNHAPDSVLKFNFGTGGDTLAANRRGPDGIAGTTDDVHYSTVAQVRDIRGVGTTTMARIEKYAIGHHFVDGTAEPKTADWASRLGPGTDITVNHAMDVYEEFCHSICKMLNLRTQNYPFRIFRGGDGEYYFAFDNRHLGRIQRDGIISMTSGGSGANPAGYTALWIYARVDRVTETTYRFTLKGYDETLPTNTLPTKRYLLVDDDFPLPLRDL